MNIDKNDAIRIARIFNLSGEVIRLSPIKNGNINSTYDVELRCGELAHRYIFQQINTYVFKNPHHIMSNIENVTSHIAKKLVEGGEDIDRVMKFYHTANGENYYVEGDAFWRVSDFVPNTVTFNECDKLPILYEAGRGFGEFQVMLSDFDASVLYETIPDFHNTQKRLQGLLEDIDADICGRASSIAYEIGEVKRLASLASRLGEMQGRGLIPMRVTHNDTKINNILFDCDTHEAKTVIDLDTVMPGLMAHDFGDAIRFAANTSAEDEPDTSKVSLDLSRFEAFAGGFLSEVKSILTEQEADTLALGAFTMTYELFVRFLDDYITGDKYFKLDYPQHNLVRARCQLALALDIEKKLSQMEEIVARLT